MASRLGRALALVSLTAAACSGSTGAGVIDAGPRDAAAPGDVAASDAGPPPDDAAAPDAADGPLDFTETYGPGTADVGNWILTTNPERIRRIEPSGGNPDEYLYGEVSIAAPSWTSASTRFQPGVADDSKRDSVFVGDYYTRAVATFSADLEVIQAGNWATDRTVTLHLVRWDATGSTIALEAYYTLPDMPAAPTGWHTYSFTIDARSRWVPSGWRLTRGDGSLGSDAEWETLMRQIDLVELGFWKLGFVYPSMGLWQLGIDNVHLGAPR